MTLLTYLRQFLADVRGQKLRAFLTVFGIVWGTAAVTLLLAFGKGFQDRIILNFKGLGENIVICWPARTSKDWQGLPHGRAVRVTEEDLAVVRAQVPQLAAISGEYSDSPRVKVGRSTVVPTMVGVDPIFAAMRNQIPSAGGRYVNPLDVERRRRVVFLGDQLKKDLFGADVDAVGRTVSVGGVPFLVVGVMVPKTQDSNYNGRDEDKAVIPASTFRTLYGRKAVDNFVFQVADPRQVEAAKKEVVATLAARRGFDPVDDEAILMWDTTEQMKFFHAFFLGFRLFLGIVGGLTLVVGGIGVSNIMYVVVEERTKEIGLKMALGARRRYVIGQFLFETLTITAAGGAVGLAIAWGLCAVFPLFGLEEYVGNPVLSPVIAGLAAGVLGLIGLLAGYFPARTAASLNPVEALRL